MRILKVISLIYLLNPICSFSQLDMSSRYKNLYQNQQNRKNSIRVEKIKKCKEGNLYYKNAYKYPRQTKLSLDSTILGICFHDILKDYHESREDFFEGLTKSKENYSDLLSYLMGNSDYDYSSGKEGKLKEWVMSQQDNSITPHSIFKYTLELNKGDLFKAILTIHQLLRNEARFYADYTRNYSTFEKLSNFFNKFIDIRGDLEERCDGESGGDHAGTWYRIWGTMLHSLYKVDPLYENRCHIEIRNRDLTLVKGSFIAQMAEIVKPIYWGDYNEIDNRKSKYNKAGYLVMDAIYSGAEWDWRSVSNVSCDENRYLIKAK
ncbi:MAG: hypothetical protein COV38_10800 [Bdellovibrionales bacterium CG11_big_fil_rev_8_21_14_0_20_38_13]|nr:MAG: hypothetical protein COV38_10800 [Bdellovibrionales bacterium CG11_big_fil_rev_8_21_14_0_20_38_13]